MGRVQIFQLKSSISQQAFIELHSVPALRGKPGNQEWMEPGCQALGGSGEVVSASGRTKESLKEPPDQDKP